MTATLNFHSITVERDRLDEHRRRVPLDTPIVNLMLTTAAGSVRSVPMTNSQLLKLIEQAAAALRRPGVL